MHQHFHNSTTTRVSSLINTHNFTSHLCINDGPTCAEPRQHVAPVSLCRKAPPRSFSWAPPRMAFSLRSNLDAADWNNAMGRTEASAQSEKPVTGAAYALTAHSLCYQTVSTTRCVCIAAGQKIGMGAEGKEDDDKASTTIEAGWHARCPDRTRYFSCRRLSFY